MPKKPVPSKKSAPAPAKKSAPKKSAPEKTSKTKAAKSSPPGKAKGPVKKGSAAAFSSRVGNLKDAWSKAKETSNANRQDRGPNENVGAGYYPAQLLSVRVGVAQKSKEIYWMSKYIIVGDDCKDEVLSSYDSLSTKENANGSSPMIRLADRIRNSGYELPDDPSELEDLAKTMSHDKPLVELRVTWSDDEKYQNANVYRAISEDDFEEIYAKNEASEEDDDE